MKPQSAKAKGRKLQQYVRDKLYEYFPKLQKDDVRSTGMGQQGSDLLLSPFAQEYLGIAVECKSYARISAYQWYWQSVDGAAARTDLEPVVVMKQNNSKPLVLMDLDYYLKILFEAKAGVVFRFDADIAHDVLDDRGEG